MSSSMLPKAKVTPNEASGDWSAKPDPRCASLPAALIPDAWVAQRVRLFWVRPFEYDDGSSRKFWEIDLEGQMVLVRFGRLDTQGTSQVKDLGSDGAAQAHHDRMIATKLKKGYTEVGNAGDEPRRPIVMVPQDGITVQRGMKAYMSEHSGACRIVVRKADDVDAAVDALQQFLGDLWSSDVFASLDGAFGDDVERKPLRYTPSFASEVEIGEEGPECWFDAQDVLECWPRVVDGLIQKLQERLRGAGVRRAQIGKPKLPYWERAYDPEADWVGLQAEPLEPLDERWLPASFPSDFPLPAKTPVIMANQAHDGSWTYVAWRRGKEQDDFADALHLWSQRGFEIVPLSAPHPGPPDVSWGWRSIYQAFTLDGPEGAGWGWIVFSQFTCASYLHVVWFGGQKARKPGSDDEIRSASAPALNRPQTPGWGSPPGAR